MKNDPIVSVIIPTYNNGDIVCDAIDCTFNQTYNKLEIIVVDDGSTDGTGRLLEKKYGSQIRYIYQENRGPSGSRNTGIKYASGKYLQFLDADDLLSPDKISSQIEMLQDISGIAIAYCDFILTDIEDNKQRYDLKLRHLLDGEKPFEDLMMNWETDLSIPIHCFLFDAAIFRKHGISFDESLPNHVDWECWMNVLALNPRIIYVDKQFANYRIRKNSICGNRLKMRDGYLNAINKQIQQNRYNEVIVSNLRKRKLEIKDLYRDVGPLMRFLNNRPPFVKRLYTRFVPWRIRQRLN